MIRLPIFVALWIPMILMNTFPLLMLLPFDYYLDWSLWTYFLPVGLVFLGLVMVPLLWRYRDTDYDDLPWWTRLWSNPEDWRGRGNMYTGSLPRWWVIKEGSSFKSFFRYHAIRNPANGVRSIELFDLTIAEPRRIRFVRSANFSERRYDVSAIREAGLKTVWYLAWYKWQAGFELIHIWNDKRHLVIKFGWRVEPSDKEFYISNLGTQDASFASKILLYREG